MCFVTYCVCRSSRLASLRVCWALTWPHAVRANTWRAEVGGWVSEGGMRVSYARTVRQRREGVRKRQRKSAHQRHVTVCHMSMHNIKQPQAELALNQRAEWGETHVLFSCFHFKRTGYKMYSHISGREAVWWEKLLHRKKRKKIIIYTVRHINSITSFRGDYLNVLSCGQWFLLFFLETHWSERNFKPQNLLAFICGWEGLIFTCPLLTVICDCGKTN